MKILVLKKLVIFVVKSGSKIDLLRVVLKKEISKEVFKFAYQQDMGGMVVELLVGKLVVLEHLDFLGFRERLNSKINVVRPVTFSNKM